MPPIHIDVESNILMQSYLVPCKSRISESHYRRGRQQKTYPTQTRARVEHVVNGEMAGSLKSIGAQHRYVRGYSTSKLSGRFRD